MRGVIKHDLYAGVWYNKWKILFGGILFLLLSWMAVLDVKACVDIAPSLVEILVYIFGGSKPFVISGEGQNTFQIPIVWFIVQIYTAFVIGSYPSQDLQTYGVNLLVRVRRRRIWWLGKVFWAVFVNALIYALAFVMALCVSALSGGFAGDIDLWQIRTGLAGLYQYDFSPFSPGQLRQILFLLPLITSLTLSILQMWLSFAISQVTAYGVIIFLCAAGAYYDHLYWLAGNSMTIRGAELVLSETYGMAVLWSCIVLCLSLLFGFLTINKKNIYGNE